MPTLSARRAGRHSLRHPLLWACTVVLLCWLGVASAAERRSVSVQGHGEVSVAPDRAQLDMSVQTTRDTVAAAQAKVNAVVRDYLQRAHKIGVRDADIATTGVNVQPQYDYSGGSSHFTGYRVSRRITVTVRDLAKLGDTISAATAAGVNGVADPVMESSRAATLRRQALADAAGDARANAEVLAKTLGATLGPVHQLDVSNGSSGPVPMVRAMAMAKASNDGNQQMGITTGEIRYQADVHADFDLLP